MSSGKTARPPFPNYGITPKIKARDLSPLRAGGGGAVSKFVCGYMTCDPHLSRPILDGLPPVFKVNVRADSAGHWLETSIMHLVDEAVSGRVGSEAMLAKLSEALFVDTLRRYVDGLPEQQNGWLAGARSRRGQKPRAPAWPSRPPLDDRRPRRRSGHLAIGARRALQSISRRAADGLSHSMATAAGRGVAPEDIARRCGHRHRHRIPVGSRLQPRVQTGVWAASRPIPDRSQAFAPTRTCACVSRCLPRLHRVAPVGGSHVYCPSQPRGAALDIPAPLGWFASIFWRAPARPGPSCGFARAQGSRCGPHNGLTIQDRVHGYSVVFGRRGGR